MRNPVLDAPGAVDRTLESLLARMKDAAFVVDIATGRIQSWNQAATHLFGYTGDEVQGFSLARLIAGPHEGLVEALSASTPVRLHATGKDEGDLSIEMTLSPLGNGQAMAVVRDVSEGPCPEMVRYHALNILSHELRTPISTVMGFGGLVLDGLAGPITEQQRHYLQRLMVAADDLHALVNDLLDLGLLHGGKLAVSRQACSLPEIISEAIEGLALQAAGKPVTITNLVQLDLPDIHADRKRILQVLRNLLSNAIKYSPPSGQIWVRAKLDGAGLCCEIEDTGPGIPLDAQPTIFQPFVRLADGSVPGAGLGLNIAEALVLAHEGRIGIRNSDSGGAIFWFTLPLA